MYLITILGQQAEQALYNEGCTNKPRNHYSSTTAEATMAATSSSLQPLSSTSSCARASKQQATPGPRSSSKRLFRWPWLATMCKQALARQLLICCPCSCSSSMQQAPNPGPSSWLLAKNWACRLPTAPSAFLTNCLPKWGDYGLTVFRVNNLSGLGAAFTPAILGATRPPQGAVPIALPFWAQAYPCFWLVSRHDASNSDSPLLTLPPILAPYRPSTGRYYVLSRFPSA